MTARSRRQTRHMAVGTPVFRQPLVHNKIVRLRKAFHRVGTATRFAATQTRRFTKAFAPLGSFYDRDCRQIDTPEWATLLEIPGYKRVAYDLLGPQEISTVWLGINHAWTADSDPIIFETMIFGGEYDNWQWRYPTEEDALFHHHEIVKNLMAGLTPDGKPEGTPRAW